MRKPLLLLAAILLFPSLALAARSELEAKSAVESVIVYPDRALVTRTAAVTLKPGDYRITFPDLPGEAVEESLRISGKGTAKAKIGTVESRKVYLEAASKDEVRKLQDEIQSLQDQDKKLSDDLAIANKQKDFYQAIQFHNAEVWSKEITVGKTSVEEWAKVVSFLENGQAKAAGTAQGLEISRRELKNKIDTLKKRLGDMQSGGGREQLAAAVEVSAATEGSLDLSVSYMVIGPSWSPSYIARADTDAGSIELTYKGQVRQGTSEDWDGVTLYLSTSKPAVGASPPALSPWYVGIYQPVPMGYAAKSMPAPASPAPMRKDKMEMQEAVGGAAMPAEVMTAQAETAGTSVQFAAITKQDIPADGSAHDVTIAVDKFKPEFAYFSAPKLMPYAYLEGEATNDREYPLLAGQVSVFLGPDYLGKSYMAAAAPGEKFKLALGIDEGIKVKRELVSRREEDTGLLTKTRRITMAYKITLESYKKAAQKITVEDQLPVSQVAEVVVKEVKVDPQPTERAANGILKWKLDIAPKEKKEIWLEYYVEFPRDKKISGI